MCDLFCVFPEVIFICNRYPFSAVHVVKSCTFPFTIPSLFIIFLIFQLQFTFNITRDRFQMYSKAARKSHILQSGPTPLQLPTWPHTY